MKHLCTVVTLAMALGIMLVSTGLVGSTLAQTNTTSNAAGNTTGAAAQNTTGNQSGIETSSEIESLTQGNPELLTNSTDVTDKTTGLADLQKEQTTTDPNMTTATK